MCENTVSKMKNEEICPVCEMTANKKCSACNNVYYCSQEHQKTDWKFHSKNCCPFKLVVDPTIGRRYVATRIIKVDELVLEEKPLLTVPSSENNICLNCYVFLKMDNAKQCDKCGWHMCSDCTEHGPECELTLKYRESKVKMEEYMYPKDFHSYAIVVMRALALRNNNLKAYERFLSHEDHCVEREIQWRKSLEPTHGDVALWIKEYMKIDDVSEGEITRILGIVETNGQTITLPPKYAIAVYDKVAYFEHSCRSNCLATGTKEGSMIVRAVTEIQKGQAITISYLSNFEVTAERRRRLRESKFFDCCCERCKDPTEFGTMFSAVKCVKKKCNGNMLPPTFLVSKDEKIPDFVCDKCNATEASELIDKMIKNITVEYSCINKHSSIDLKKFIEKQARILHKNHCIIFTAQFDLAAAIFNREMNNASVELLKESVTIGRKLSKLFETLMPELYFCRGITLFQQHSSSALLMTKQKPSSGKFRKLIKEHRELLTEAYRFFCHEPLMEQPFAQQTLDLLCQIDELVSL